MVPSGLISRPERTIAWVGERIGRKLTAAERREVGDNVVAEDFFPVGERIRKDFDLDHVVGITPFRVAWDDDETGDVHWNYFSAADKKVTIVSSTDLRGYARDINARFEAFLVLLIIDILYVSMFYRYGKLGYHENTGCVFDFDEERDTIKEKIIKPMIDKECRGAIPAAYRPAMDAFINYIGTSSGLHK
jgi:hypothetical protein